MRQAVFCIAFSVLVYSCAPRLAFQEEFTKIEAEFQDHTGFLLYDPIEKQILFNFNSNKYFTPASNTKILTFYTSLQLLGDSIPALKYIQRNDSLIFWGTGDPSFLYSEVFQSDRTFNFLSANQDTLYFSPSNFRASHFGPGWAWDDYNYSYSAERSSFPIYGNCVALTDSIDGTLSVTPGYFQQKISTSADSDKKEVTRGVSDNAFVFTQGKDTTSFSDRIPFHTSPDLVVALLSDTIKKTVKLVDYTLPVDAKIVYSIPADSLYRVMMQESDNFIAEQLLLMCAGVLSDTLKPEIAIRYAKEKLLFDLPDQPKWVDGSGLSRYNLITPRSIVRLWEKIATLVPQERLFNLLAVGGESGTISNSYKEDEPYIFGKTGTLSNNHCLSGFLKTKKGKILIFSFMSNNYTVPTQRIRDTMQRVLKEAHELY